MNRLFEISEKLGEIARQRFELKQKLVVVDRNLVSYERSLIPAGGWPGSNADQRKAAELAVKEADIPLRDLHDEKSLYEDQLASLEVDREALILEKEAWQWTIRDRETQYDSHRPFDVSVFQAKAMYDEQVKSEAAYAEYMEEQEGYAQDLQRGTIDEVGSPKNDADDEIPF